MKIVVMIILFSLSTHAKTVKVAVLDSGFDFTSKWSDASTMGLKKPTLCKEGHKDFTNTTLQDRHGHGTHVAGIIAKTAKQDYCLVILKVYDPKTSSNTNLRAMQKAMAYARQIQVNVINYSGGGVQFDVKEYIEVKKNLDAGILIVAAAGNGRSKSNYQVHNVWYKYSNKKSKTLNYDYEVTYINRETLKITKTPQQAYFPAAYDPRIIAVKSYGKGVRHKYSNYGAAYGYYENGKDVMSLMPNNKYGKMTGTSMAAPKKTAQIINNWEQ